MLERERWVDQEAVASGPVIKDVDLRDQETFASVATRLLGLSGYVASKLYPDSLVGEVS
jgi:hypothetical protein